MIKSKAVKVVLLFTLLGLLFLSTNSSIDFIIKFWPKEILFLDENRRGIVLIAFLFQAFILVLTILFEVFLLFFIVRIFLKKTFKLSKFVNPVLITAIIAMSINIFYTTEFLSDATSLDIYRKSLVSTPVNYILKPFLICFFLFATKVLSSKISDWFIVGLGYLLITYIPGFLLITFLT